jgi:exopolyphosphatase/guanosine-5'-triphosphate,3'-diphosphate pyrophosphatase
MGNDKSLIIDIGGGSVEMLIANSRKIYWKHSYKTGAALLLDKFKPSDPLTKKDLKQIHDFFHETLQTLIAACREYRPVQLIGSAGSFETFASMIRHRFPVSGSHYGKTCHPLEVRHFEKIHRELVVSDVTARNRMKGLIKMRVDMIVMASLLLNFVLQKTHIEKMKLSMYSLKEGALWEVIHSK